MLDTGFPTASSRPLVTDMLYAALPTLPCGGTGDPGPRADEGLAIDPELGARIASLLSRLFFGREEKAGHCQLGGLQGTRHRAAVRL
jgi:hypothetical protein